jgi:ketosteroid isomerase-like protein
VRQENIDLVRGVYNAYVTGNADAVMAAFDSDIAWHTSGHDPSAGTYEGIPAVLGYLMGEGHMTDYALTVTDILASDERVAVVATTSGRRGDAAIRNDFVQLIRVKDGRIAEVWNYNWDQRAIAEFMSVPL